MLKMSGAGTAESAGSASGPTGSSPDPEPRWPRASSRRSQRRTRLLSIRTSLIFPQTTARFTPPNSAGRSDMAEAWKRCVGTRAYFRFRTPAERRCLAVCRTPGNSGILFSPLAFWAMRAAASTSVSPARVTRSTCMTRRSLVVGCLATAMYVGRALRARRLVRSQHPPRRSRVRLSPPHQLRGRPAPAGRGGRDARRRFLPRISARFSRSTASAATARR